PAVSPPAISLDPEVALLVEQKRLADLEDLWMRRMEATPEDLPFFFGLAAAVKKKSGAEGAAQAISWLGFLADYQAERKDLDARVEVLTEVVRMSPTDPAARASLERALSDRFRGHPALAAVLAQHPLAASTDPSETARRVARWLRFVPGEVYYLAGRGAGRIAEMNPALDVIRLEVGGVRIPLSLASAEKNLEPLPPGHFLREKVESLDTLRELAAKEPAGAVRRLLDSFGRPLSAGQVRELFAGIVDEERWTSFWTSARRHPQLLVAGAAKSALVSWSESASAADETVRREFAAADPAHKLELARKHGKRSRELVGFFAESLASEARGAASEDNPSLAWELSQAAAKLAPGDPEAFPAELMVASKDLPDVLRRIRDHTARERALQEVRARLDDWETIFATRFLEEEDQRVLSAISDALAERPERREEIVRRVLRTPRTAPRVFVWLAERLEKERAVAESSPSALFQALLDALRQDEFATIRARVKALFEPGGLAVSLVRRVATEEEARELAVALSRAGGLEEHRRGTVREALFMKYPSLRAPAANFLYATPESIEARRDELARLKQVDLPANAEAMKAAKEHGDLKENFEYHAARQKHEYLSARIAGLADQLSRTRALDPSRIDASEVRVGTRVLLRLVESGRETSATILGPWDSRPEGGVYSYESEFAMALLGKRVGESVRSPQGDAAEVVSIAPWR
ncbi:MAG: GreA/GreB family elongation factor, partial [Acidobacteriota bacterium]